MFEIIENPEHIDLSPLSFFRVLHTIIPHLDGEVVHLAELQSHHLIGNERSNRIHRDDLTNVNTSVVQVFVVGKVD